MEKDKESTEINPTKVYWEEFTNGSERLRHPLPFCNHDRISL